MSSCGRLSAASSVTRGNTNRSSRMNIGGVSTIEIATAAVKRFSRSGSKIRSWVANDSRTNENSPIRASEAEHPGEDLEDDELAEQRRDDDAGDRERLAADEADVDLRADRDEEQ